MRRDFEGGDDSRCGEISRKYGIHYDKILLCILVLVYVYNVCV